MSKLLALMIAAFFVTSPSAQNPPTSGGQAPAAGAKPPPPPPQGGQPPAGGAMPPPTGGGQGQPPAGGAKPPPTGGGQGQPPAGGAMPPPPAGAGAPPPPPRSLKAFANPAIFDEMAGVLPSALGWLGSQLKAMEASIYFYRDTDQQEVGLLVESGDTLYPVGIKKTVSPWQNARRQFDVLDKLGKTIGLGAVLCLVEHDLPLPQGVKAVPVGYL